MVSLSDTSSSSCSEVACSRISCWSARTSCVKPVRGTILSRARRTRSWTSWETTSPTSCTSPRWTLPCMHNVGKGHWPYRYMSAVTIEHKLYNITSRLLNFMSSLLLQHRRLSLSLADLSSSRLQLKPSSTVVPSNTIYHDCHDHDSRLCQCFQ